MKNRRQNQEALTSFLGRRLKNAPRSAVADRLPSAGLANTSWLVTLAMALFLFINHPSHAQGNLLLNGDFSAGGGSLTNWSVGWNNYFSPGSSPPAPSNSGPAGSLSALFQGEFYLYLGQTISTTPGTVYDIRLWVSKDCAPAYQGIFDVWSDFQTIQTPLLPGTTGAGYVDYQETATSSTTTFAIVAQCMNPSCRVGLADISITPVTQNALISETPEPASAAILGLGAIFILASRKSRSLK